MIHLLRYDDFSAVSSTPVEEALIDLLERKSVPCTFAVIPFVCDPADLLSCGAVRLRPLPTSKARLLQRLLDRGLAEIAIHGFAHLALAPMRGYQELSDRVPADTQRALIQRARGHLEDAFGTRVRLFVPPWNRLARTTARVLDDAGLLLSADLSGTEPDMVLDLAQVPCALSIEQTQFALRAAGATREHVVGTLLHDYDFAESGHALTSRRVSDFEQTLESWIGDCGGGHSLVTTVIEQDFVGARARVHANARLRRSLRRVGRRVLRASHLVFWNTPTADRLARCAQWLP